MPRSKGGEPSLTPMTGGAGAEGGLGGGDRTITPPVPRTRLRGRLRRGSRISPAVKVTLFQASALNREPTIAPAATISAISQTGPLTSLLTSRNRPVDSMPDHRLA